MSSRLQDKKIENIIIMYYNDIQNIEAYESKIRYYNENKHRIKRDFTGEIENIKEIVSEIRFKNKHLEEIINGFPAGDKKYLELKYKHKLTITQIKNRLNIKERNYYRIRKKILNYFNSMLHFD